MEHKYAQVLRWIADGKKVEARLESSQAAKDWRSVAGCNFASGWFECLVTEEFEGNHWEFRLAPRTVKVGDVSIEAPLRECKDREIYWYVDHDGLTTEDEFVEGSISSAQLRDGRLFATKQAAEAAHAAWAKLMTQGEA